MHPASSFDVLIIGGSYAGLSAALALGRSRRRVLVIDSGRPCNRQTPHSHNFLTQDGETPAAIAGRARAEVARYDTVAWHAGLASGANRRGDRFVITTGGGQEFSGDKLLFATGLEDVAPPLPGFAECWGISVLHCPYCHGYEVRDEPMGVLANGDMGFEFARLIHNWSRDLVLFTNGPSTLPEAQAEELRRNGIGIDERPVASLVHQAGQLEAIAFGDGARVALSALFARPAFRQHCDLPELLGCTLSDSGHLSVDEFGRCSVPGIYAAGDCTTMFRSVSAAIAGGSKAAAMINRELIAERF